MNDFITFKFHKLYTLYCRYRLNKLVPGLLSEVDNYSIKTKSTGMKLSTLYQAIKTILIKQPNYILESGTGTSTIALAYTILHIKKIHPDYDCKIISMESINEYYQMAQKLLPDKYKSIVQIILGERERYNYSIFRGYSHSNIPKKSYDFILLDGPSYDDENGSSTNMDAIKIRLISDKNYVSCVIDTRVSTAFMMQKIFGKGIVKYFPIFRTCSFDMPQLFKNPKLNSSKFKYSVSGKIDIKKMTYVKLIK
jgi:hypothetical protein